MKLLTRLCEGGDDLDLDHRVCRPENKEKKCFKSNATMFFMEINKTLKLCTPDRTYSMSGLKYRVLRLRFLT